MQPEADELIEEDSQALQDYLAKSDLEVAEDICAGYFGLGPDYVDLIENIIFIPTKGD